MAAQVPPDTRTGVRPKLSVRVISVLREQLLSGAMSPGERLPSEIQLTARFGVSRTVIREAVAALSADGLVEARQGVGVFVTNHPASAFGALAAEMGNRVSTALSVLEVRLPLEVEAAGLAALRRSPAQEAVIHEAFFEFERLARHGVPTGPADLTFHRAIALATGNPFYSAMLDALGRRAIPCDVTSRDSTEFVQSADYQQQLQREHLAILTAISAANVEDARGHMRTHLASSQARYRSRIHERQASYAVRGRSDG